MIRITQFLCMAAVLLSTMVLLGSLRPLQPTASYLLTGVPIMMVELALALCFARGFVASVLANAGAGVSRFLTPLLVLVTAAMVPTVIVLFANQALDRMPGVEQTLPVTRTYSSFTRGDVSYYAVVALPPKPRWLFPSFNDQEDIRLPRKVWQRLVPKQSTLRLTIHPGRFGLLWYDL